MMQDTKPGDVFLCILGIDPSTDVKYTLSSSKFTTSAFSSAHAITTFKSKIALWNEHQSAIGPVIIKDIVPEAEPYMGPFGQLKSDRTVVLTKPAKLEDALEGEEVEVEVWVEDIDTKGKDDVEQKKTTKDRVQGRAPTRQAKVMWEKSAEGNGIGERRYQWRCEEVRAGERVLMNAQWEVGGSNDLTWHETRDEKGSLD